jgi:hypothetical protein
MAPEKEGRGPSVTAAVVLDIKERAERLEAIRAKNKAAAAEDVLKEEPHKQGDSVEDSFDYHGNFTAERFEAWLDKLCRLLYFEIAGEEWVDGVSEPLDRTGTHADPKRRGGKINMDGASYHMRCVNKSPTKGSSRPEMIKWLEANHPDKLTPADKADWKRSGKGGLTIKQLFAIIEPLKPAKKIAAYAIAAKYGHEVRAVSVLTPSFHPSHLALNFLYRGDLIWGLRMAVEMRRSISRRRTAPALPHQR